jgi:hypothetical protein
MAKIAYILLCHKDPAGIIDQARRLTAAGDYMAIHFDGNARLSDYEMIRRELAEEANIVVLRKRVRCGWGEWSLVEATLQAVRAAVENFPRASHFYMLSGDCMSIKSAEYAHDFLDREDVDFIESFDFFASDWIKTGIREERLIYRHWFNERKSKTLFYASMDVQKRLGLARKIPEDIQMMIGSQWWCLRRRTVEQILQFTRERRDVMRFFRTTWIPDETFFQTLVRHLVPEVEIRLRTLTFLMFTDYGMPVTFYNDHYEFLLSQDYLFARKISPDAKDLKRRLGEVYQRSGMTFPISGEGKGLIRFLTERGRVGRRFAPRFWEAVASLGRERSLLILTCKKWHVAKRIANKVSAVGGVPTMNYLFNEASQDMPDLGGIQSTIDKRTRHRRALIRMLFDYWSTDRLIICIDPASFDLIQDFFGDKADVRMLEIQCQFTDDYLIGHAKRVGLASDRSPPEVLERLLPTIRHDVKYESDRLRDADFQPFERLAEGASPEANAVALSRIFGLRHEDCLEIASDPNLFND